MRPTPFAAALAWALVAGSPSAAHQVSIPPPASLTDGVWLKGDLHVHSRHSLDSTHNPVAKIIAFADAAGLDYLAITDHDNHVSGDIAHHTWTDPQFRSDSLLLLYGAEWTTHRGHGNVVSAKPYDHQRLYDARDLRDVKIGRVKAALGVHISANHPFGKDNFGFSYDLADSIEVWNSAVWPKNTVALAVWDDMLKSGRKLTGRGGSDSHHGTPDTPGPATPQSLEASANQPGTPTTWVYAKARARGAVVQALDAGRVSITANPYAPRIEFVADLDGDGRADTMMGDNVRATGRPVAFTVRLAGGAGTPEAAYTVRVVKDGETFGSFPLTGGTATVTFVDTPPVAARSYYRVQVEGPIPPFPAVPRSMGLSANMLGLSNPIHFNFDPTF